MPVRPATPDDLPAVRLIYDEQVATAVSTFDTAPPPPSYWTRETSVYLAAPARGRGQGRALYDVLLERLRADDVHTALAVVALPNDASEALHEACGFERVGVLPEVGHKLGRWIDTALYARLL